MYMISFGAPNFTNSSNTFPEKTDVFPVVNFPSEKVPAPPSPNCMFVLVFNTPLSIKLFTSSILFSTFDPCSIIIGSIPLSTSVIAVKSPAGPAPTITGL